MNFGDFIVAFALSQAVIIAAVLIYKAGYMAGYNHRVVEEKEARGIK